MRALCLSLLVSTVALASPTRALAEPVGLLELRLIEVPPALKALADRRLKEALTRAGDQPVFAGAARPASTCALGPCLTHVGRKLGVDVLLTGAIAAHGSSSFDILLTLVETGAGTVLAQVSRRCDVCNYADVGEAVAKATARLLRIGRKRRAAMAWLELRSQPPGAAVTLDGVALGTAPQRRLVGAGEHRLAARARGARSQRMVTLKPGERRTVTLNPDADPAPLATPGAAPSSFSGWRWLGWSALGVGAAAGAAGGILSAEEHQTAGAVLLGAGGAALASGALVLILERVMISRRSQGVRATALAGPRAGGVVLSLSY